MRIKDMITQDESYWYFNKFSPLLLLKMLGFKGLSQVLPNGTVTYERYQTLKTFSWKTKKNNHYLFTDGLNTLSKK